MPEVNQKLLELEEAREAYKSAVKRHTDHQKAMTAIMTELNTAQRRLQQLTEQYFNVTYVSQEAQRELEGQP